MVFAKIFFTSAPWPPRPCSVWNQAPPIASVWLTPASPFVPSRSGLTTILLWSSPAMGPQLRWSRSKASPSLRERGYWDNNNKTKYTEYIYGKTYTLYSKWTVVIHYFSWRYDFVLHADKKPDTYAMKFVGLFDCGRSSAMVIGRLHYKVGWCNDFDHCDCWKQVKWVG